MKKYKGLAAAVLVVAVIAAAVVGCNVQTEKPATSTEPATATATPTPAPTTMPTTAPTVSVEPLLYDPTTHENGYCEGNCWEGICPYFTGYPEPSFTYDDVEMMAKTVWGEARGCPPDEQRLVVWTVLQRIDAGGEFRNYNTVEAVVTKPNAFVGYDANNPIDTDIYEMCLAEMTDWWRGAEPPTHEVYAPNAPYYFFDGDGTNNWFREEWR